jgi:hypothetical protein
MPFQALAMDRQDLGWRQEPPPLPTPIVTKSPPPNDQTSRLDRFLIYIAGVMTTPWHDNMFVWLPALAADPNSGATYGVLPVLLIPEKETHHIRHLIAPTYTYNQLFGQSAGIDYYFYPNSSSQLYASARRSEHTNRDLELSYEQMTLWSRWIYFRADASYEVDGSKRFYGIGPRSRQGNQSGFTLHQSALVTTIGANLLETLRLTGGVELEHTRIGSNVVRGIPDINEHFPETSGLLANDSITPEIALRWDSRDQPETPTRGSVGKFFFQRLIDTRGAIGDYNRFGLEGSHSRPWERLHQITWFHALYDRVTGEDVPFYNLPSLGGRESLRGFGDGRFVDRGRLLANIEQRITVTELSLTGMQIRLEVAPFIDCGTVFPELRHVEFRNLRPVFGSAFRAVVAPNVVASVDAGVGNEGLAVFVGLNYPF